MAIQTLNTIKNWFKTTLKPTQQQFWDTWDSFRHKFEKVPIKDVEGIEELLNTKADKTALNNHISDKNAHAPQVNTDWNSESGFSQLLNKPEFKTINGESIIGTSNIDIAPTLQQVMDKGSAALVDGEAGILSTSNNGYSRFYLSGEMAELNNLDTDLKKAVSMSLKDGDLKITSQNTATGKYTTVNLSEDPKVNTEIFFPNKEVAGNYTLATLDDISGAGNQDLKSVLENGSVAEFADGKRGIYSFDEDSDTFETYSENNFGMWTDLTVSSNYLTISSGNTNFTDKQSSISVASPSEDLDTAKINFNLINGGFQTTVDFDTNLTANTTLKFPAPSVEGNYTIATTRNIEDALSGPIARIIPYGEVLVFKTSPEGNPKIKESGDFCLGYINGVFISGTYAGNNSYDIKSELEL